ncbi:type 2 periplasmic-binding domain-containing protein [Tateyamaria pelophila]|uniref:hypothetical protein n=1 Tax=Tateyamaria pelophila TaxID=328415 RepID=UPI001CC1B7F3|nr:hypothetical protein [Tateyamaria pelophila]
MNHTAEPVPRKPGDVDLAVCSGQGGWSEGQDSLLIPTGMGVMASSSWITGQDTCMPKPLSHLSWLDEIGTSEITEWPRAHVRDFSAHRCILL